MLRENLKEKREEREVRREHECTSSSKSKRSKNASLFGVLGWKPISRGLGLGRLGDFGNDALGRSMRLVDEDFFTRGYDSNDAFFANALTSPEEYRFKSSSRDFFCV